MASSDQFPASTTERVSRKLRPRPENSGGLRVCVFVFLVHCLIDATAINRRRKISRYYLAVAYEHCVTITHCR